MQHKQTPYLLPQHATGAGMWPPNHALKSWLHRN
jgi:hypothetical protein